MCILTYNPQANKKVEDWIWPPGYKIRHNWGCVKTWQSQAKLKPCCDTDPVECEENFVALRSHQDFYALAIPMYFKYQHEAGPICQKGTL